MERKIKALGLAGWISFIVSIFGVGYSLGNQTVVGFTIFGVFIAVAFSATFYEKRLRKGSGDF
jgi:protein-S-isoprenylcysteine O-methyltransferase Ste14